MPRDRQGEVWRCKGVTVLLVDDNAGVRTRRADCLCRWGHPVHAHASARAIGAKLPRKTVLVIRQELPDEPGIDGVVRSQQSRPDVPAILITSRWSPTLAAAASSYPSVWLRPEPISDEELHVLVDLCSAA
jgi:DNA-binding NtrC family response regulator